MLRLASRSARVLAATPKVAAARAFSFSAARAATTYFTETHEYLKVDGKKVTVGITNYAQSQLGDVVFVSLPEVGQSFQRGEAFAAVESVKAASDVYSPCNGKVVEINKVLSTNAGLVNESPEDKAWFVKVELAGELDTKGLLEKAAYDKHCESAAH